MTWLSRTTKMWPSGSVSSKERCVAVGIGDDGDRETFRLPSGVGVVDIVDHQVPSGGAGDDVLGLVADRQVGSAPHLQGSEVFRHRDEAHPDLFVEACRCGDVSGLEEDVDNPERFHTASAR
jgi:hypothetical protein